MTLTNWNSEQTQTGAMKKIEAIFRHFKLEEVKDALLELGVGGMTVIEVHGIGRQTGKQNEFGESSYKIDFLPKIKLEIVVSDEQCDDVVTRIQQTAKTGEIGDGKIMVTDLADLIRIRTGEKGEEAI